MIYYVTHEETGDSTSFSADTYQQALESALYWAGVTIRSEEPCSTF